MCIRNDRIIRKIPFFSKIYSHFGAFFAWNIINQLAMQNARYVQVPMIIARLAKILINSHQIATVLSAISILTATLSAKVMNNNFYTCPSISFILFIPVPINLTTNLICFFPQTVKLNVIRARLQLITAAPALRKESLSQVAAAILCTTTNCYPQRKHVFQLLALTNVALANPHQETA